MALTDSIQIPVDLKLEPLNPAEMKVITDSIGELTKRMQREMAAARNAGLGDLAIPSVTGTSQFESKGKMFELSGKIRADAKELEDGTIQQVDKIAFSIKEVKDRIVQDITEEAKRLREFKTSIRHQPKAIKLEKIKKYISEFGDINDELSNRANILTKSLEQQKFLELKSRLANLPPGKQVTGYTEFLKEAVYTKYPVRRELKKSKEAVATGVEEMKKRKYEEFTASIETLGPEDKISAIDEYMKKKYAWLKRATYDRKKLQDIVNKMSYQDAKANARLAGPERAEAILQEYIDKGGAFSKEAQRDILFNKEKLRGKTFREMKKDSVDLPIGERAAFWEEYIKTDGFFKKEARRLADKDIKDLSSKTWSDTKKKASLASTVADRPDVYQKYMDENPTSEFMDEARIAYAKSVEAVNKEIKQSADKRTKAIKDAATKESNAFKKSLREASMLPSEQREGAYQAIETTNRGNRFEKEATFRLHKNQKSDEYIKYSEKLKDASLLPYEERMKLWQKYIDDGGLFKTQAERQIRRASAQYDKSTFNKIVRDSKALELKDQSAFIGSKMAAHATAGGGVMAEEQMNQFAKIDARISKKSKTDAFQAVKLSTTGMTDIDAAIAEWEAYLLTTGADIARGQAEIRKLVQKGTSSKATRSRRTYSTWAKSMGALDPNTALRQIDAALSSGQYTGGGAIPPEFIDDIKGMRRRVDKAVVSRVRQDQKDRSKQFANNVLIGAGAGLGLLGPAGFPLLNIGFAAMSGGPIGAGIAAVSTALGESVRAINAHTEANKAAAMSIGAIPNAFKSATARGTGYDAAFGAVALSSEAIGEKERLERWKKANLTGESTRLWKDLWQTAYTKFISGPTGGASPGVIGLEDPNSSISEIWRLQRERSKAGKEPALRSAYNNALMEFNKPTVGVETDPYQTWLRMQQNAFDPSKVSERKWQEEVLKALRDQLAEMTSDTIPPPIPPVIP